MTLTVLPVRQPRLVWKPYAVLAGLQVLDVLTTWVILTGWSVRGEGNPLVRSILDNYGLNLGLLFVLVLKLAAVGLFYDCQTKVKLASAIYSLVIFNNLLFLGLWAWTAVAS